MLIPMYICMQFACVSAIPTSIMRRGYPWRGAENDRMYVHIYVLSAVCDDDAVVRCVCVDTEHAHSRILEIPHIMHVCRRACVFACAFTCAHCITYQRRITSGIGSACV